MKFTMIATAAFGLEGVVAQELKHLGFDDVKGEIGGARFISDLAGAFRANLWLRTADRVLLVLKEAEARTFEELFQTVSSYPWEDILPKDASIHISGKCVKSQLMSVSDCQSITKKAIVERLKKAYKLTWLPETGDEYPIETAITHDTVRLTLDTSGTALNRRGYRTWNGEAPLRETLAAALVRLSPWHPGMPLYDPCCGTGTLLIEAALQAANRAPGLYRSFAMENWPIADKAQLRAIREEAQAALTMDRVRDIAGSDIDPDAIELCHRHITQAGLEGLLETHTEDLTQLAPMEKGGGVFLCNPPYGERLGDKKSCEALYRKMRKLLDDNPTWRLCVITSDPMFERCLGRRATKKRRLYNGRLECEFMTF